MIYNKSFQFILRKLNVKAVAMLNSFLLALFGTIMIFMGIKDQGMIDLKAPFISGHAKSGFVGILLVFFPVVIAIACLAMKKSPHKISIKKGEVEIECEGSVSTVEDLEYLERLIEQKLLDSELDCKSEQNRKRGVRHRK